ncbi:uncharacterized protein G2W53_038548 [Senna tora]|uniref:Uncharacterized protein n=1 Tax=Senna tora TaxID=362788 RepID=A0A834SRX4_9FABA|nr:uncharacterized protein G2W53_038548 [Senna tora]
MVNGSETTITALNNGVERRG